VSGDELDESATDPATRDEPDEVLRPGAAIFWATCELAHCHLPLTAGRQIRLVEIDCSAVSDAH
jgi:hypothetical protein